MKNLNLKLIGFLLLGAILFTLAFEQIFWLYDIDLTLQYMEKGKEALIDFGAQRVSNFLLAQGVASLMGLLLSFFLSLFIVIRTNKGVINAVVALIFALAFRLVGLLKLDFIDDVITYPGKALFNSIFWISIANAIVLIAVALLVQLSQRKTQFIK